MPTFHQFLDFPTRGNNILDQFYNIAAFHSGDAEAYRTARSILRKGSKAPLHEAYRAFYQLRLSTHVAGHQNRHRLQQQQLHRGTKFIPPYLTTNCAHGETGLLQHHPEHEHRCTTGLCVEPLPLLPLHSRLQTHPRGHNTILKFADDTLVVGRITSNNEAAYRTEDRENLVSWNRENNLILNAAKTKEMKPHHYQWRDSEGCADHQLPRGQHQPRPDRPTFNITATAKKGLQRFHFPRCLKRERLPRQLLGELLQVNHQVSSHVLPHSMVLWLQRTGKLSSASLRLLRGSPAPSTPDWRTSTGPSASLGTAHVVMKIGLNQPARSVNNTTL